MSLTIAARAAELEPFYVMEVVKAADRLQAAGRPVIHLSIGEPDFTAPALVRQAAVAAIECGTTQYTPALGLTPLRESIAAFYLDRYGVRIDAERIVVTAGASAALLLAIAALVERDAEILMADPSYPCNRHFVTAFEGRPRLIACGPQTRYQLTADVVLDQWREKTRGVMIATPSNPTGTSIARAALKQIIDAVAGRQGFVLVDEIYQGLSYDSEPSTALSLSDQVVVLNSFSKYFSMTGWRLGWMVVPRDLMPTIEKLAQNLFICPSAIAQHAALGCFLPESIAQYESRRAEFKRRRDYLVPALQRLGFGIPVIPDGAFYIYADVSALTENSWDFAFELLQQTGVCVVPGRDFGNADPARHVRISYATSLERLMQAVELIEAFVKKRKPARSS